MKTQTHSPRFLQQRRFYTVLPLLVLPFLTLLFWQFIMKRQGAKSAGSENKGLILKLPDAFFKDDKELNKMSFYQKAAADSARLRDLIAKDPYYRDSVLHSESAVDTQRLKGLGEVRRARALAGSSKDTPNVSQDQQVKNKLTELDAILKSSSVNPVDADNETLSESEQIRAADLGRLEKMMAGLGEEDEVESQSDPEMQELNTMLDKILQIQNPDLAIENLQAKSVENKKQVFPVTSGKSASLVTSLENTNGEIKNPQGAPALPSESGFFSIDSAPANSFQNAITAEVDQTQKLVAGSTIKFRLTNDVFISGQRLSAGTNLFGKSALNQERLQIQIESVRSGNSIFPVKLSVYDLDGVEGIYIPGALEREVGKQSSGRAVQGVSIPILDPSLGAQAASAGIEAAKTFMGRKAKLTQVTVKAGYKVLLVDSNNSN